MDIPTPQQAPGPILSDIKPWKDRLYLSAATWGDEGAAKDAEIADLRAALALAAVPGKEPVAYLHTFRGGTRRCLTYGPLTDSAKRELNTGGDLVSTPLAPVGEVVAAPSDLSKLTRYMSWREGDLLHINTEHPEGEYVKLADVECLFAALPPQAPEGQQAYLDRQVKYARENPNDNRIRSMEPHPMPSAAPMFDLNATLPAAPAPTGLTLTESQMHAIAKVIAGRVAKNASVAPELCFAPALFALQDAFGEAAPAPTEQAELPPLPDPFGMIPVYADDAEGNQTHEVDGFDATQMRGYAIDYANQLGCAALAARQAPTDPAFIADLERSRTKHPGIARMFDGLLGEVHELARAYGGDGDVRAEAFDVAVCAYRIAVDGDTGGNTKLQSVPAEFAWGAAARQAPDSGKDATDAARYRWLRAADGKSHKVLGIDPETGVLVWQGRLALDVSIDAAQEKAQ